MQPNEELKREVDTRFFFRERLVRRQPKPYVNTLPYRLIEQSLTGRSQNADCRNWDCDPLNPWRAGDSLLATKASNQAYSRFVNQLGDGSSFGATLTAERKETVSMVTSIVTRAVKGVRHAKQLRFGEAAKAFGIDLDRKTVQAVSKRGRKHRKTVYTLPNGRRILKNAAGAQLLVSYGIKPLASDIYAAVDTFTNDLPSERFHARGFSQSRATPIPLKSELRYAGWGDYEYVTEFEEWSAFASVRCGATITVSNPDAYLLNKMGLSNPVQWAVEGVPFSFVVDWFSNLSDVINSITDFNGLSIDGAYTSTYARLRQTKKLLVQRNGYMTRDDDYKKEYLLVLRSSGLPTPRLVFSYERPSWQRALNAISLLVGFLPRK